MCIVSVSIWSVDKSVYAMHTSRWMRTIARAESTWRVLRERDKFSVLRQEQRGYYGTRGLCLMPISLVIYMICMSTVRQSFKEGRIGGVHVGRCV